MATEKRLVDAHEVEELFYKQVEYGATDLMDAFDDALEDAKTVDAVEVPCRCKECKYWKHFDHLGCTEFVKVCTLAYYMIGENGYCLYGERFVEDGK